jgi:hypothetical protein
MDAEIIATILLALLAANVAVTIWLLRVPFLLSGQKLAQLCLVWSVPVLGAAIVTAFLASSRDGIQPRSRHIPNEDDYPGVNMHPPGES